MRDPAAETLPWAAQAGADDAPYRAQIAYLFERSPFYRARLTGAGFPDAASVGGLAGIAALPMTEKDELRASRSADSPMGAHLAARGPVVRIYSTSGTTGAPSYIPLTAFGPRRLDRDFGAILCRLGGRGGAAADLHLWCGAVRGGCGARRIRRPGSLPHSGGAGEHREASVRRAGAGAGRDRAHAVLCVAPGRDRGRPGHRPRRIERRAAARRGRAGGRGAGDARPAGGGLGRAGHRGHGDRRHRGFALGRVRGQGGHALLRARLRAC